MKQALHIFKKDVHQFWCEITVALALVLALVFTDSQPWAALHRRTTPSTTLTDVLQVLLPIAWAVLIARAIQAEALPGDRQFWLTRPYDRKSLWAAKAMFVLAFANLPMLLAQAVIVTVDGFSLTSNLAGLVWEQILLTALFVIPAAAIAAVTASMAQFVLCTVILSTGGALAYAIFEHSTLAGLGGFGWLRDSAAIAVILALGLAILYMQFMRRKTFASRTLGTGAIVLGWIAYAFTPWSPVFAIQSWLKPPFQKSLNFELDHSASHLYMLDRVPPDRALVVLPVHVTGPADASEIRYEAAVVTIQAPSGLKWRSDWNSASINRTPGGFVERLVLDRSFIERAGAQPVQVHTALYLTWFGNRCSTTISSGETAADVPGVGQCSIGPDYLQGAIVCRAAFRWPPRLVSARMGSTHEGTFTHGISYSPFPAELLISPVESYWASVYPAASDSGDPPGASGRVSIITEEPLSHFRKDFEIRDVRLSSFMIESTHRPAKSR